MSLAQAKKILVPVDFSPVGVETVKIGAQVATNWEARLCALHVASEFAHLIGRGQELTWAHKRSRLRGDAQQKQEERLRAVVDSILAGAGFDSAVVWGRPAQEIPSYAAGEGHDLIVMATSARFRLSRLFACSLTERVIRHSPCPVLVCRVEERLVQARPLEVPHAA